jgi:hypothetical protein
MHITYGMAGAFLSFAGGVLLALDAIRMRSHIYQQRGSQDLLKFLKEQGAANVIKDDAGEPLNSETALQLWFANRSLKFAWIGFVFMTLGFLFQFLDAYYVAAAHR